MPLLNFHRLIGDVGFTAPSVTILPSTGGVGAGLSRNAPPFRRSFIAVVGGAWNLTAARRRLPYLFGVYMDFRAALAAALASRSPITLKLMFDELGIDRADATGFLSGRSSLSIPDLGKILNYLGYRLER